MTLQFPDTKPRHFQILSLAGGGYMGYFTASLLEHIEDKSDTNKRLIWKKFKLAFLAPDIQLAILSGTQPHGLCLQDFLETDLEFDWPSQRKSLGFAKP